MQQRHAQPDEAGSAPTSEPRSVAGAASCRALLLDSDLFFAVKVTETLKHAGYIPRTVRRAEHFAAALKGERPAVALINAGARGVDWRAGVEAACAAGVPVVVYAPHVDVETHEAARGAGATSVIANSKLAADLPGVVARALRRGNTTAEPRETTGMPEEDRNGEQDADATTGGTPDAGGG